jgi:hypothetical protein
LSRTVKFEFFPFEEASDFPKAERSSALKEIGEFLHYSVLTYVDKQNSPVSGHGAFKKLSPDYKKAKVAKGGEPVPNLELTTKMLTALKVKTTRDSVVLSISGKQGDKADGHNNHSGESSLPMRRFIPDDKDGETFKRDILSGVKRILKSFE